MSSENTFEYTYSPVQNQEVLDIRNCYLPAQLGRHNPVKNFVKTMARRIAPIQFMKEVMKYVNQ